MFGTASGVYSQQRTATYSTYGAADMCSQPASAWGYSSPGVINTAVLKGLAPNTTYYYVFGQEVGAQVYWGVGAMNVAHHVSVWGLHDSRS